VLSLENTGRAAAAKRLQARIVLTADVDAGERHWTEAERLRPWTPAPRPSIGCARPGSTRAWKPPYLASPPLGGRIANWRAVMPFAVACSVWGVGAVLADRRGRYGMTSCIGIWPSGAVTASTIRW
jgi:hypothetical protein